MLNITLEEIHKPQINAYVEISREKLNIITEYAKNHKLNEKDKCEVIDIDELAEELTVRMTYKSGKKRYTITETFEK